MILKYLVFHEMLQIHICICVCVCVCLEKQKKMFSCVLHTANT
jgi:hypothetical protein